jgi:hypothetical protein
MRFLALEIRAGREQEIHVAVRAEIVAEHGAEDFEAGDAPAAAEIGNLLQRQFQFEIGRRGNHGFLNLSALGTVLPDPLGYSISIRSADLQSALGAQ